ncbi:MAG: kinase [Methanomassiliicoccaceae archaeon]|jgi:D-glycero-alpha-D-manno-heptose-7-phosphate kinase|nr:kinase [Methanomassiliicoccaceae archaeon]
MKEMIRARAPLRIGMAGGGTDVEPYASERGGYVFNTTIDKYAYCTVVPNGSDRLSIVSLDYGAFAAPLDGGPLKYDGNMDLIKAVSNHFRITDGFDVFIHSDAPPGSGLGGSSTVIVAILGAITEWLNIRLTDHELADLAFRLEREELGLKGGKQDQYAAVFGGFNLMEFKKHGVRVHKVHLKDETVNELQYCSLLCYTGRSRDSANIIEAQMKRYGGGSNVEALDAAKKLAKDGRDALMQGNVRKFGEILNESWAQKKRFTPDVTNSTVDELYSVAMDNGAIGGKVSGAGGGGFMYFVCEYDKKHLIAKELQKKGARITDFMFERSGVQTWRHRE